MTVVVHVNRRVVASNQKRGTSEPALIVRRGRTTSYHHEVEIVGPARMVYRPHKPLPCGARAWVEAADAVPVDASP